MTINLAVFTKTFKFLITCLNPLLLHKLMDETLEKEIYVQYKNTMFILGLNLGDSEAVSKASSFIKEGQLI